MPLTNYKYEAGYSLPHAIAGGYRQADKYWGIPGAASGASQYAICNKERTASVIFVTLSAMAFAAACVLSPACATFVGAVGTRAAALVSPAITAMSTFAVAHPLIAGLVVLAAVGALIAAPVCAYKNSNKAIKIEEVKQGILSVCEKDGNDLKFDTAGHLILISDKAASTLLNDIAIAVGLVTIPKTR